MDELDFIGEIIRIENRAIHLNNAQLAKALLEKRISEEQIRKYMAWDNRFIVWLDYWEMLSQEEKVEEAKKLNQDEENLYASGTS